MSNPQLPSVEAYDAHGAALDELANLCRKSIRYAVTAYEDLPGEEETLRELEAMRLQQKQLVAVLNGQLKGWIGAMQKMSRRGLHNATRATIEGIIEDLFKLLRQMDEEELEEKETTNVTPITKAVR